MGPAALAGPGFGLDNVCLDCAQFQTLGDYDAEQKWRVGDFNGDGKDDLVNVYGRNGVALTQLHLSTGSGFEQKSNAQSFSGFSVNQSWVVGDYNSDGMDDLVNIYDANGNARAWQHLSTGSGFEYQSNLETVALPRKLDS